MVGALLGLLADQILLVPLLGKWILNVKVFLKTLVTLVIVPESVFVILRPTDHRERGLLEGHPGSVMALSEMGVVEGISVGGVVHVTELIRVISTEPLVDLIQSVHVLLREKQLLLLQLTQPHSHGLLRSLVLLGRAVVGFGVTPVVVVHILLQLVLDLLVASQNLLQTPKTASVGLVGDLLIIGEGLGEVGVASGLGVDFEALVLEFVVLHKLIGAAVVGIPLVHDVLADLIERTIDVEIELE
jgi:hypothetical protein